jgi:hypothetical protein
MRFIVIAVLVFGFFGCQFPVNVLSEKELAVDKILYISATNIKKETGLIPFGSGGQMMDQVKEVFLSFKYHHPVDIDTARELLITASEILLHEINSDEMVRPYLDCYPFEPKNVKIEIYIQKNDFTVFGEDQLCVVSTCDGLLKYETHDPETPLFKSIYEETYQEALQKVVNAKELSKVNCSLPQTIKNETSQSVLGGS